MSVTPGLALNHGMVDLRMLDHSVPGDQANGLLRPLSLSQRVELTSGIIWLDSTMSSLSVPKIETTEARVYLGKYNAPVVVAFGRCLESLHCP